MKEELEKLGFAIVAGVISEWEITEIIRIISNTDTSGSIFRKSKDLFAIRQFFKHVPDVADIIMASKLKEIIGETFGQDYFVVKSIYFDKPPSSNWFVSYHQDLTISVKERGSFAGFGPWTVKEDQFSVQPPLKILEDNITVRIHLDHTSRDNGALKIIPGSHLKGVYRPETIDWTIEREIDCEVPVGGAMIMKPLLLHSSGRTINNERRRVVHVEFSRSILPEGLEWSELINKSLCS